MAASSPEPSQKPGGDNTTQTSPPPPPPENSAAKNAASPTASPKKSPPPPPPASPPPSSPPPAKPAPPPSSPPPPASPSPPPPKAASPPPPVSHPPPEPASPPPPADSSPPPPSPSESSPPPPSPSESSPPPPSPSDSSPPPPPEKSATPSSPPPSSPPPHVPSPSPPGAHSPNKPLPPPAKSLHPPPSGSKHANGPSPTPPGSNDLAIISGIIVGGIALLALIIICLAYSRKKKKPHYYIDPGRTPTNGVDPWSNPQQVINIPPPPGARQPPTAASPKIPLSSEFSSGYSGQQAAPLSPLSPSIGSNMKQFGYEELAMATDGFSRANLLGQGGFGYVHKGVLPNKWEVAVKSLKTGSGQGEREFQAEVEIISRVHHRHLVSLDGYCIANEQRLLVYEFVPNKTMEFHLHGKDQPVMDWSTRLKIGVGSAKGLAYLHEDCHPRIIHRDIKSANILLDNNFEAMVADFGLAKLTSDNYTHVSTRVMGTFGYLAPEYASSGKLTEKSDVFSFGVMLLELITGRRPVDPTNLTMEDSLVDWARPLLAKSLEDGNFNNLVDPRLEGNFVMHEMACMVTCAAASIRHSARRRPKMSQIAHALEGDSSLDDLNEGGVKPGQSKGFNTGEEVYNTMAYNADMMKFKKMVLSTQDFTSSEYEGTSDPYTSSGDNSREMPKSGIESKRLYK